MGDSDSNPIRRIDACDGDGKMEQSTSPSFLTLNEVIRKTTSSAVKGGTAGGLAMSTNVVCLMWLRTIINYQQAKNISFQSAMRTLYRDGGIRRFHRGLGFALVQGPMCRFGDVAANTGMLTLLDNLELTKDLSLGVKTMSGSALAALFRIVLMPIDTVKVNMQVTGKFSTIIDKVKIGGVPVFFQGSIAVASSTFLGHYLWFCTFNELNQRWIPKGRSNELLRNGVIGFCSSAVRDICLNSIRVVKIHMQTAETTSQIKKTSYSQVVRNILSENGLVGGLMFRGLETKLLANGIQGIMFSILWKHFEKQLNKK